MRSEFLSLLQSLDSHKATYSSLLWPEWRVDPAIRWTLKNRVRLREIVATQSLMNDSHRAAVLSFSGSSVRTLNVSSSSTPRIEKAFCMDVARWCPNITEINILVDQIRGLDAGLLAIAQSCRELTKLGLWPASCTSDTLSAVFKMLNRLTCLELKNYRLSIPVEVALPTLTHLDICCCRVPDETAVAIGQHCARLKTLKIFNRSGNRTIRDTGVQALLEGCPLVDWQEEIMLAQDISVALRVEMASRCHLSELNLDYWLDLSAPLLQGVLRVSPALTIFNAGVPDFNYVVDDATMSVIADHCPLLRVFNGVGLPISDDGVIALVGSCRQLETFGLIRYSQMTENTLQMLADCGTALKTLRLDSHNVRAMSAELRDRFQSRGVCVESV